MDMKYEVVGGEIRNLSDHFDFLSNYHTIVDCDVLMQSPKEREMIENSYKNAINSANYQFGRFINKLKTENAFDDAIIVLFSDHGERLFDKEFYGSDKIRVSHTDYGYNALVKNTIYN